MWRLPRLPQTQRFFGEVFFLLGGLKSAVLFSNLPTEWRHSFALEVVVASGILEADDAPVPLALYAVGDRVETAAEFNLSGDLVVLSQRLTAECEAASESLQLRPALDSAAKTRGRDTEALTPPVVTSESVVPIIVSERDLARLFDYPVALSECREAMMEVRSRAVDIIPVLQPIRSNLPAGAACLSARSSCVSVG